MSKSELTLKCETIFKSAFINVGDAKLADVYPTIWSEQLINDGSIGMKQKRIDFVAGYCHKSPYFEPICRETQMVWPSMVGCELKTSGTDFHTGYGKNYNAYHYNYLIVPKELFLEASVDIKKNPHLGLILIDTESCTVKLEIPAKYIDVSEEINRDLAKQRDITEDDCNDIISILFTPNQWEGET